MSPGERSASGWHHALWGPRESCVPHRDAVSRRPPMGRGRLYRDRKNPITRNLELNQRDQRPISRRLQHTFCPESPLTLLSQKGLRCWYVIQWSRARSPAPRRALAANPNPTDGAVWAALVSSSMISPESEQTSHTGLQRHWEQGPSQWADLRRAVIQLQMEQAPIDTQRSVLPLPPATSLFAYDILPSMCLCLSAFVVCPSINTHTHTWFLRQSRREQLSFLCNQTLERSPETNF